MTAVDMIQQLCTAIFDGIAMVQKTRGDQKTLAEVGDSLMYFVLNKGTDSKRIDVIFDVYKDNSIKSSKRERRAAQKTVMNSETSREITRYINGANSCPIPKINRS